MKSNNSKKVLETEAGHDRNTVFFPSKGRLVGAASDYGISAIIVI